jgi:hypothetical protein
VAQLGCLRVASATSVFKVVEEQPTTKPFHAEGRGGITEASWHKSGASALTSASSVLKGC